MAEDIMLEVTEVVPQVVMHTATPLLYDLAVMVNAVYQMKIEPTQQGLIPKRIVKKLRPLLKGKERSSLYDQSDSYADMLYELLAQMDILYVGLMQTGDDKPTFLPGPALKQWQQASLVEQSTLLLKEWTNKNWGDTVIFIVEHRYNSLSYLYEKYKINFRQLLINSLEKCTIGAWYSISALLRGMWEEYPALNTITQHIQEQPYYPYAYYSYGQQGKSSARSKSNKKEREQTPDEQFQEWLAINSSYVLNMFFSSLHEMGFVELGYPRTSDDTNPSLDACLFRLTELADQVFHFDGVTKTESEQKLLIIQPNYEILLLQPDMPTLYHILPFTQIKQIDQASTLLITQASVFQAIQQGLKFEEDVLGVLQKYCMKEIPQNVLYTLQEWQKLYQEVTVSYVSFLEVSNEETAQRLYQNATLRTMGIRHIAPCLLIIPVPKDGSSDLAALRKILAKENIVARFLGLPDNFHSDRSSYARYM
ncbi:helicase-associated domain-containing protein [Dictyobacter arantiisoli]|uniref:Helicase XPB/Ssl2 N-terminal domain-containing protein n=1 Tax=Dictyobacter arantiisoli TaxID=2014874 RepID=A0A5A5T7I4_9CHLR|nr:helicase-associated domain-containing protein [Dictyobacter arantiisoli]GCF07166.1 hypothetical protein KDI_07300 [Dictyobacter arantiisoli]